jgi:hypothetical protein
MVGKGPLSDSNTLSADDKLLLQQKGGMDQFLHRQRKLAKKRKQDMRLVKKTKVVEEKQ